MNPHQSCWPQSTGEIKHSSLPLLFFKHSSLLTHGVVLISEETKYLALSVTSYLWYRRKHISRWKARTGGPGSQKQLYTHGISHPKHQVKKWDAAVAGVVEDKIKWKMVCVALILFFQTGCVISTRPLQFFTIIVPALFFLIALKNIFIWGKIFPSLPFLSLPPTWKVSQNVVMAGLMHILKHCPTHHVVCLEYKSITSLNLFWNITRLDEDWKGNVGFTLINHTKFL